jgi:hypothetical protein
MGKQRNLRPGERPGILNQTRRNNGKRKMTTMNELTVQNAYMPVAIADMKAMAAEVASSGLLPGIRTPQAAFVVAQHVTQKGMTFIEFLSRYHVTNQGTVSVKADVQLADMMKAGIKVKWVRFDGEEARALFIDEDGYQVEIAYTIEEARNAGLLNGPNDNWKKRPDAMLRARLISKAKRMICPGDTAGLYNESETDEIEGGSTRAPVSLDPVAAAKMVTVIQAEAAPVQEAETVPEVLPTPFAKEKKAKKEKAAPSAVDFSTCPIPGEMFGVAWADMEADILEVALALTNPEMLPGHFEAVKAAAAAKGVQS